MKNTYYSSAQEAEDAFYRAFEKADLELMNSVWSDSSDVECIHPMSERLSGKDEIEKSWRSMFKDPLDLSIRIISQRSTLGETLAIHVVNEYLTLVDGESIQQSVVHATNVYQLSEQGWKMIIHHASPSTQPQQKQRISSESIH